MQMNSNWHGKVAATGVMDMSPNPDFAVGKHAGRNTVKHIPQASFPRKHSRVRIAGVATVLVQGCNGDPTVSDNWHTVATLTSTNTVFTDEPWQFYRYNVSEWTSGDVEVDHEAVNH